MRIKGKVSSNLNWKLNQRTEILLQQINIAVRHEVQTVYGVWPTVSYQPMTTRSRYEEPTHVTVT